MIVISKPVLTSRVLFVKLLVVAALAASASSIGGLEWYKSSPGGIPESPIDGIAPRGWSLSIEYADDAEIQILYLDGVEQSSRVLVRKDGRLVSSEEFDAEGKFLGKSEYAYDVDGSPRAIYYREGKESAIHVISDITLTVDYENNRHLEGSGDSWRITDMGPDGRRSTLVTLYDGGQTGKTSWIRDSEGNLREELSVRGTEERRIRYDPAGRMVEEEILDRGVPIMLRSYVWEGDRLVRVEERGNGVVEIRETLWLEDGIVEETRTINGVISSKLVRKIPDEKIETLYKDGKPFIQVHWKDGRKLKEKFLDNKGEFHVSEGGL